MSTLKIVCLSPKVQPFQILKCSEGLSWVSKPEPHHLSQRENKIIPGNSSIAVPALNFPRLALLQILFLDLPVALKNEISLHENPLVCQAATYKLRFATK